MASKRYIGKEVNVQVLQKCTFTSELGATIIALATAGFPSGPSRELFTSVK
jgi:hypothetical protein